MFLALVLALAAPQADPLPSAKVTASLVAAPASKLLPQLGELGHAKLQASGTTAQDVIAVTATDKPLGEVMRQIAQADGASWQQQNGIWRLVRTEKQQQQQEQQEVEARAAELEKAIQDLDAEAKKPEDASAMATLAKIAADHAERGSVPGPYHSPTDYTLRTPIQRALIRLAAMLDPRQLATLEPGDRIAYSTQPLRLEEKLPDQAGQVLDEFAGEQALWAKAVADLPPRNPTGPRFAEDPLEQGGALQAPPVGATLVASRSNSLAPVDFRLYVWDAQRSQLQMGSLWLTTDRVQKQQALFAGGPQAAGDPLKLSADAESYTKAYMPLLARDPSKNLEPDEHQKNVIATPADHDPLSFTATEGFQQLAAAKHEDLVAVLPDDMLIASLFMLRGKPTLEQFQQTAETMGAIDVAHKDGWTVVTPTWPVEARKERTSREALQTYLQSILKLGRSTLENEARYAFEARDASYDMWGIAMVEVLDPLQTSNVDHDWPTLRLLGSLTPDQMNRLEQGPVPITDLTPVQQRIVEQKMLMHGPNFFGGRIPGGSNNLMFMSEATESLPDGFGPQTTVAVSSTTEQDVIAFCSTQPGRPTWRRILSPGEVASFLIQAKNPPAGPNAQPLWDRYLPCTATVYHVTFSYSAKAFNDESVRDIDFDQSAKPVPFDQLPDAFKQAVQKQGTPGTPVQGGGGGAPRQARRR